MGFFENREGKKKVLMGGLVLVTLLVGMHLLSNEVVMKLE